MEYRNIQDQLEEIIQSLTNLTDEQKKVLSALYAEPGKTMGRGKQIEQIKEELCKRGLLLKEKKSDDDTPHYFPIPLSLLDKGLSEDKKHQLASLDKWIQYPFFRNKKTRIKTTQTTSLILKWLFDIHSLDWQQVFCFGDYESFIQSIGFDVENDWIQERAKKGRTAKVLATKDGKWARRIHSLCKQELRDCLIDPTSFSDLFIMSFPDIQTTIIGSSQSEITFVHSSTVAHQYRKIVEEGLT